MRTSKLDMNFSIESWPLQKPFTITGSTITEFEVVVLSLSDGTHTGIGEAIGVSYFDEDAQSISRQLGALRGDIEGGAAWELQHSLRIGGARNALDCALWDLRAKTAARPVWDLAGLPPPRPLLTTFTIGADSPAAMAAGAKEWPTARALKLKLIGDEQDAERVRAVRAARPDTWIAVDANQGFTLESFDRILGTLVDAGVQLVEQPFARGCDHHLDDLGCPIPMAADESIQGLEDLERIGNRWNVINIKLDKCGGLSEGIEMAKLAKRMGRRAMVGTMGGTSLAMSPGFLLGQLCDVVDLDGPLLLSRDRSRAATYCDGNIWCSEDVWGAAFESRTLPVSEDN
jgi:L-Ala-D/L-Glu epimerase